LEEAFPRLGEKEDPDWSRIVRLGLLCESISSFFLSTSMQGVFWGGLLVSFSIALLLLLLLLLLFWIH
jgi:hypothetical protein